MQNHEEQLQQVEIHIDHAKKIVAFGDAVNRLVANKDFQTVIDQGYFSDESRRLTMLTADENLSEQQHAAVIKSLCAIGEFNMYLRVKLGQADQMRKELAEALEAYSEMAEADGQAEGDEA